ncbi:hypothetical protein KDA11_05945, partial [Candidatus Saccharibacteria bacterium]|nr:hypothetical protein [Candidatus Saccharibacteria bacterium]
MAGEIDVLQKWLVPGNLGILLGTAFLSMLFIALRAVAWSISCAICAIPLSFLQSLKITYNCALVDLVTFPARVTADAFRFTTLEGTNQWQKAGACAIFRLTTAIPYLLSFIIVSAQNTYLLFAVLIGSCIFLFSPKL